MDKDKVFLEHILEAIEEIFVFVQGDKEVVYNDAKTKKAVSRDFEIIGEASGNISDEIKQKNPNVPWREIKDFRNVLIHEYFDVDYEKMWEIMEEELPRLKEQIKVILKDYKN